MNCREKNYDILRIIAAFMVISIHVSAESVSYNIAMPNSIFSFGNFFNSFSRFGVPIFIMLSGAFLLTNPKNTNFSYN